MKKIFRFDWDCGRNGDLEGIFIATQEEVDNLIGQTVYFGEVLGKHSDVYGEIEAGEITLLTDDQDFIEKALEYNILPTGYNPFDYIDE